MSRFTRALVILAAGGTALGLACALASAQAAPALIAPLPLGKAGLAQSASSDIIAPGLTHYRIRRGSADNAGRWVLMSGVVTTPEQLAQARRCFDTLGLTPSGTAFQLDDSAQQRYQILSGGNYPARAAAQAAETRARDLHCQLFARHSTEDAANSAGPWLIDVVELKPDSGALLSATAGAQGPALRRQASSLAKASGALVAVNGGFFVERDDDGFPGQPSGVSVLNGQLNSSPVTARPAVLLGQGAGPAAVIVRDPAMSAYLLWQDGSRTTVDGVNRRPGLVRDCGRGPQDRPIHDYTCSYADDIVYFPAGSGYASATAGFAAPIVRFAIGADGMLRSLAAGTEATDGEAVLAVTGASARLPAIERLATARVAAKWKVDSGIDGALAAGAQLVNGGPTLLMAGSEIRDDVTEGWGIGVIDDPKHDLLMHEWINRRNPRTALGVKDDGTVLLVTVDGHLHGTSVGMTIEELRAVLKSLGARDAINLDGGGSTAMVIGGRLINHPSDLTGERAVGDAVVILPRRSSAQ